MGLNLFILNSMQKLLDWQVSVQLFIYFIQLSYSSTSVTVLFIYLVFFRFILLIKCVFKFSMLNMSNIPRNNAST